MLVVSNDPSHHIFANAVMLDNLMTGGIMAFDKTAIGWRPVRLVSI